MTEEEAAGTMPSFGVTTGSDTIPSLLAARKRGDTTTSGAGATDGTTRQHVASQEEGDPIALSREKTGDMTAAGKEATGERKQPLSLTEQGKNAKEQDPVTIQILAYLARHPRARQAEVADALGSAIRTVQRKLASWRRQPSGY